ncbi:MAG TPA: thioredoxin family protein [Caldisericia bacterium]|jgi:small redox-active disulfide protein 2|nr:thioredoxin family protein [Caldisericia bacterium]HOW03498.1 thioredoxin family protein [Caldisericia bacterium]HPO28667.1 thioredoxin family protein [Caldisericia bacterium]HXK70219.1 thioredoxin family protein [Caldisericia bacterium]
MKIKVLGVGCANCKLLLERVKEAIRDSGVQAEIEYITDMKEIMKFNVMSMPGLVINDKVVSTGKVLSKEEIISKIMTAKAGEEQ